MEESKEQVKYAIDNKPRLLRADEIECRVGTITAKGCSLLLYKDARVDMKILDETYGVGNWQRTHEVVNDNLFCTIEIWNDRINQWVKKQDVGIESRADGTGNEKKGEASDSFKRAGFNAGIGRELYTSPFIWIIPKADMKPYNTIDVDGNVANEFYAYKKDSYGKGAYTTKTTFELTEIGYDKDNCINKLTIKDNKGNVRFQLVPEEEQKEIIKLMQELKELIEKTKTDREKFYKYYKVTSDGEMTLEQLRDAVEKLKTKEAK